ncbi:MAG: FKBP-type peptidyl-prolyl cis-trans isomerase [Polyangiaceae bacterium]
MRWVAALVVAVTLAATACNRGPSLAPDPPELVIEERAPGSGEPAREGDHVAYWYTVRLLGTTEAIDSNVGKVLYEVDIGQHKVIAGMEQGLTGMRPGAKRRLLVPSRLAYGRAGKPPRVPPDAPLDFDVEMVTVARSPPPAP